MSKVKEQVAETNAVETPEKAPKFSIERLGEDCRKLFDVSSCVYAGATYGLTGEYTVAEMKSIIEKWKNMEVK